MVSLKEVGWLLFAAVMLVSCGGAPDKVVEDIPELSLASIEINGEAVALEEGKTGIYEISMESDQQTASIKPVLKNTDAGIYYVLSNADESVQSETIYSGDTFSVELEQGANLLRIYVIDSKSNTTLSYVFQLYRASITAGLSQLNYYYTEDGDTEEITLSPSFETEVYEYTANVDYGTCYFYGGFAPAFADNVVSIGNEIAAPGEIFYAGLEPGENRINTFVVAGDGQREVRYSVAINRAQPTEAQLNTNALLASLAVDGYELDFLCRQNLYELNVNSDTTHLLITAIPEVDGVAMAINDRDLVSGEPISIPIESDDDALVLTVTSLNGNYSEVYTLYLNYLTTNRTRVTNSEELQFALQNANPNDEIVVAPGYYYGVAGLSSSGNENAAFYSARSGTPLARIYLSAEDADEDTVLFGDNDEDSIAFLLEGNYWQVSGIEFNDSQSGIVLNGADSNRFFNIEVSDTEQAFLITGGSSYNEIVASHFTAVSSQENTRPLFEMLQDNAAVSRGNELRRNLLTSNGAATAIKLQAQSKNTLIESNRFDTSAVQQVALINSNGSDTVIRFNTFYASNNTNDTPVISVEQLDSGGDMWGENTTIYQNWLIDAQEQRPLVQSNTAINLQASENIAKTRTALQEDYRNAVYQGEAVQIDTFASPQYRIRLAENNDLCVGIDSTDTAEFVVIRACSESESQIWQLEIADDYYVYLKNRSSEDTPYLMPVIGFTEYCGAIETASSVTFLTEKWYGYAQHWALLQNDSDEIFLSNRQNSDYGLTVAGSTFTEGTPLVACPFSNARRQAFKLELID
ncbi:cadherin-like protein [Alteromonadaceae bacterium 2753L.S.0a.02]|nr:cadherin-like protein [Alteromonadaceae bacterium 2753L.S.0a.02]